MARIVLIEGGADSTCQPGGGSLELAWIRSRTNLHQPWTRTHTLDPVSLEHAPSRNQAPDPADQPWTMHAMTGLASTALPVDLHYRPHGTGRCHSLGGCSVIGRPTQWAAIPALEA